MNTLFISDLHLSPNDPKLIQLTVDFLQTEAPKCDALYILGDLFNTWLGDDIVPDEFSPLIEQLKKLHNAGIKTYLMVGNRDFMMGQHFAQQTGCELLDDSHAIDLYGTKTLLLHGDTLCTDDVSYQRYRKWVRNSVLQWVFRHLPISFRQHIANKIKQKSTTQKQVKSARIMDVNAAEVELVMSQAHVTQLIHGHTHRPAIHKLMVQGHEATRIVLGDWGSEISYLACSPAELRLVDPRV